MADQVAIVTGASSGIGEATAHRLQQTGFVTYAGARRLDRMAVLADQGVHVAELDVTDDASMVALVDRVLAEQGRVDVLVNNAGYGSYGAVEDVPLDEGRRQLEVNLFGLARMSQLVIPSMRAAGTGRILNVSSIGGHFGEALGAWYHASKFAVEGFSDSLRLELHGFGIHVVVIEPGAIRTEWGGGALDSARNYSGSGAYAEQVDAMAEPLRPGGQPRHRAHGHRRHHPRRRPGPPTQAPLRHPVLGQGHHRRHHPGPRPPPRRRRTRDDVPRLPLGLLPLPLRNCHQIALPEARSLQSVGRICPQAGKAVSSAVHRFASRRPIRAAASASSGRDDSAGTVPRPHPPTRLGARLIRRVRAGPPTHPRRGPGRLAAGVATDRRLLAPDRREVYGWWLPAPIPHPIFAAMRDGIPRPRRAGLLVLPSPQAGGDANGSTASV